MTASLFDIDGTVEWIKDQFKRAKKQTAIVGMSGGIDSAVVGALCVKALGKENVVAVTLPCVSSEKSYVDAKLVIDKFDMIHKHVNLDNTFYAYTLTDSSLPKNNIAQGNVKARLRMIALYDFAFHYNGLVVGTTNKTESQIGYASKYGDHGVDIEPIQDFYKTEIFEMARLLDVPEEIINKKPTADLWNGQTDEEEIGLTYEKIDEILKMRNKEGYYSMDVTEDEEEKVYRMIYNSHHKRNVPPSYERLRILSREDLGL